MRRPVFINLAVDRPSAVCTHVLHTLGVPIDKIEYIVYLLNL